MSETGDRITCPKCGANNFPSSAVCWQCGEPLPQQQKATPPPDQQPTSQDGQAPPSSGQQPPHPGWHPTGDTSIYVVMGFVFVFVGVLMFCCCPVIFSVPGMALGGIAYARGDKLGLVVLIIGGATIVLYGVFLAIGLVAMPLQDGTRPRWPMPSRPI